MQITNEKIYNYPMFATDYFDYVDNQFVVDMDMDANASIAVITVKTAITNSFILKQLEQENFGLFLHVECLKTRFREAYRIPFSSLAETKIEIPSECLLENIEAFLFMSAQQHIKVVGDDNFDIFYKNENIEFPQYAYVGYTETFVFDFLKHDRMNAAASIVKICVDSKITERVYDLTSDEIVIFLPEKDYNNYVLLAGKTPRTKQSIFAEPAVCYALNSLKTDFSAYMDKKWCRVLMSTCNSLGFNEDDILNGVYDSYTISSKIFKNATSDALKELVKSECKGD